MPHPLPDRQPNHNGHPGPHNTAPAATPSGVPSVVNDEGELDLYHLHSTLFVAYSKLKTASPKVPQTQTLDYLEAKDPARARKIRRNLQIAALLLDEAIDLVDDGIHWPTIEACFCPSEDGFIDTPHHWYATGRANAQSAHHGSAAREAAAAQPVTALLPDAPRPAALRRLGRNLRSECETEKRRFYAIARDHGLATGAEAGDAMRAALSELFGETIKSRKDLTVSQWSRAASAIQTEDLSWLTPKPQRGAPRGPMFSL